jgi:hypothetical protein
MTRILIESFIPKISKLCHKPIYYIVFGKKFILWKVFITFCVAFTSRIVHVCSANIRCEKTVKPLNLFYLFKSRLCSTSIRGGRYIQVSHTVKLRQFTVPIKLLWSGYLLHCCVRLVPSNGPAYIHTYGSRQELTVNVQVLPCATCDYASRFMPRIVPSMGD